MTRLSVDALESALARLEEGSPWSGCAMPLDLRPGHLAMMPAILHRHVPDREVWAFGSRAKGGARPTSDLDLCIIGGTPLSYETAARLRMDNA